MLKGQLGDAWVLLAERFCSRSAPPPLRDAGFRTESDLAQDGLLGIIEIHVIQVLRLLGETVNLVV